MVTDRIILDNQLTQTIKSFLQVGSSCTDRSGDLRRATDGIIITTVQKFPYILDDRIDHRDRKFAIIIDEAPVTGSKTQRLCPAHSPLNSMTKKRSPSRIRSTRSSKAEG